jgi:hypothetical protein
VELTTNQIARIEHTYSMMAEEPVTADHIIGTTVYLFGSEIATLRIFRKNTSVHQGYSKSLQKFYVSFEINL